MISFVKFDECNGVWANKDKALEYMVAGYQVFSDETCTIERTQEDIEAIDETIRCPETTTSTQRSSSTTTAE
ncbi:MAG: hypothetical protein LUH18_03105 [Oscillospiraceae bacterium]|nr:hypothetical protein [Oscillospiraceae bacterium]